MVRRDGHRQQAHQRMFVAVGRAASGCGLGRSYRTLPPLGRVHLLDNEEARIGDQIVVGRYRYRGAAFFGRPRCFTLCGCLRYARKTNRPCRAECGQGRVAFMR